MREPIVHRVGVILNGVTGRMGTNQHLMRSLVAIIQQGGVMLNNNERILPDPILVGRNEAKLRRLCEQSGVSRFTTDLDKALADPHDAVYFDAQTTPHRAAAMRRAIAAGKHVYCEKPVAVTTAEALALHRLAVAAGCKNGVVQDKLFLPGIVKLWNLIRRGFFGRILSVRGEFGYWVFEGQDIPGQRPSWNYRREDGGGIILDMLCHWRYLLDNLFGPVQAVCCRGATHIPQRVDENGNPYVCSAEDAAYATFELEGGIVAQFNSSWCVRVRRDDLLTLQVDGTDGSAVAGLRDCWVQPYGATPRPVWNPDVPQPIRFLDGWLPVPEQQPFENAFKVQWELFLRHVVRDEPFRWSLLEGAKGLQLVEAGMESWKTKRWVEIADFA